MQLQGPCAGTECISMPDPPVSALPKLEVYKTDIARQKQPAPIPTTSVYCVDNTCNFKLAEAQHGMP